MTRPLRIAMVAPLYRPHIGGVQTHVESLTAGLQERGHHVTVFTQEPGVIGQQGRSRPPAEPGIERFRSVWPTDRYPVAPGLATHLRRVARHYDVVHLHGYHGAASLAGLALPAGVPVVFTPHYHGGGHSPFGRGLHLVHRPVGRALVGRSDAVIAVSAAEAALLRQDFPDAGQRVHVVANGVRQWSSTVDRATEPVLLTVARLERYKRVDRVIDVLCALGPPWSLRIIGSGPEGPALQERAVRLGLEERVRIDAGLCDRDMADAYASAWAYASMSEHEAFGLTVLEAAAAGLHAVVSDIPAHRELATLAPGRVETACSTEVVADKIRAATSGTPPPPAEAPDWLGRVGWPAIADATAQVYRRALADKAGPRPGPQVQTGRRVQTGPQVQMGEPCPSVSR